VVGTMIFLSKEYNFTYLKENHNSACWNFRIQGSVDFALLGVLKLRQEINVLSVGVKDQLWIYQNRYISY
jgi:hypothetical protein